jgi:RHS repeat-associated protein
MTRLVSKKTDGVITRFYWDGDALLGDVTDDDTREWIYYSGSFVPLVMIRNEEFYLYHNDPNGCPSRLLDESGKIVWAARYDAWGKIKKLIINDVDQPIRLQGQYFDRETGLYYNRFRYYYAEIGAFVSQDPLGLATGENMYAVASNVQNWIDPLGLSCESINKMENRLQKLGYDNYNTKRIMNSIKNGDKIVIVGENMKRVNAIARMVNKAGGRAVTYNPRNWNGVNKNTLEANRSWIRYWAKYKGVTAIDIGRQPTPRPTGPSPFYGIENRSLNKWGIYTPFR